MSQETDYEIPDQVQDILWDEEIENMRSFDGWAVGTVSLLTERDADETIENVWIELMNGNGRAGNFGGVRFLGVDSSGELREAYAYPSKDAVNGDGWYVESFTEPADPDIGQRVPGEYE